MSSDPVFQATQEMVDNCNLDPTEETLILGKWYHWFETWADWNGPFDTREEAVKALETYVKEAL